MRDKNRWWKRFFGGLIAAYLLFFGYLFLFEGIGQSADIRAGESAQTGGRFVGELVQTSETSAEESTQTGEAIAKESVRTKSDVQNKKIALTFDDGPHPVYTPLLLEGLRKRGVKATFFLIGSAVEEYPEIAEEIAGEGHLIGNHTFHHVSLQDADEALIETEVVSANEVIETVTGQYPQFIRPPFGQCTDLIESQTGMLCVLWTIDPLDWCTSDAAAVVRRVVSKAKENDIILLHDQYKTSVMAAFTIIDELQKEGFEFVTADEILLD